jgi:hypothetical protein
LIDASRLEVGQHAAQPAVVDIGMPALRLLGDDVARLVWWRRKESCLVRGQLADNFNASWYIASVFRG